MQGFTSADRSVLRDLSAPRSKPEIRGKWKVKTIGEKSNGDYLLGAKNSRHRYKTHHQTYLRTALILLNHNPEYPTFSYYLLSVDLLNL